MPPQRRPVAAPARGRLRGASRGGGRPPGRDRPPDREGKLPSGDVEQQADGALKETTPLHLLPGLAKVLKGARPCETGKGAGTRPARVRLQVATKCFLEPFRRARTTAPSAGNESFGKAPLGALLGSIPLQVRRCRVLADAGVIDRSPLSTIHGLRGIRPSWTSLTGHPVRGAQHGPRV
jgi:hypothetical protein